MKRSTILYGILIGMVAALVLLVIAVPQAVLDYYETYFLWVYIPIWAFLWFRAYLDHLNGINPASIQQLLKMIHIF